MFRFSTLILVVVVVMPMFMTWNHNNVVVVVVNGFVLNHHNNHRCHDLTTIRIKENPISPSSSSLGLPSQQQQYHHHLRPTTISLAMSTTNDQQSNGINDNEKMNNKKDFVYQDIDGIFDSQQQQLHSNENPKKKLSLRQLLLESPITTYTTIQECLNGMNNKSNNNMGDNCNDLTVVLFFAHYCKLCHKMNITYKKLAYQYGSNGNDNANASQRPSPPPAAVVKFTRFETSPLTKEQLTSLGITRVPHVQMYRNGICVASFSTRSAIVNDIRGGDDEDADDAAAGGSKKQFLLEIQLRDTIDTCLSRSILEWNTFLSTYNKEIQENKVARQDIQDELDAQSFESNYYNMFSVNNNNSIKKKKKNGNGEILTLASESQLLQAISLTEDSNTNTNTDDDNDNDASASTTSTSRTTTTMKNNVVVVMYHSNFEPSCVRAQHQYRRLAESLSLSSASKSTTSKEGERDDNKSIHSHHHHNFILTRIESSVLSERTLKALGVTKYPYVQVYQDGGTCVASFSIPQTYMFKKLVGDCLQQIQQRSATEWKEFYQRYHKDIQENQHVVQELRTNQLLP